MFGGFNEDEEEEWLMTLLTPDDDEVEAIDALLLLEDMPVGEFVTIYPGTCEEDEEPELLTAAMSFVKYVSIS